MNFLSWLCLNVCRVLLSVLITAPSALNATLEPINEIMDFIQPYNAIRLLGHRLNRLGRFLVYYILVASRSAVGRREMYEKMRRFSFPRAQTGVPSVVITVEVEGLGLGGKHLT